jgi:hypothetical protein
MPGRADTKGASGAKGGAERRWCSSSTKSAAGWVVYETGLFFITSPGFRLNRLIQWNSTPYFGALDGGKGLRVEPPPAE